MMLGMTTPEQRIDDAEADLQRARNEAQELNARAANLIYYAEKNLYQARVDMAEGAK